jgi:UDPglucose--hexose-1-phosphate uridylyltransferase
MTLLVTRNVVAMSELRHDAVSDRLVIVAEARGARPHTLTAARDDDRGAEHCPFCPGHEDWTPPETTRTGDGRPGSAGWRVRVFPNLYPITDAHEVVVLSPDHDRTLAALTDDEAVEVFLVLRDRVHALREAGSAFATAILNQGRAAGASIAHPHAQVFALDFVPPEVLQRRARQLEAPDLLETDVQAARQHDLLLDDGEGARAWCPYASIAPLVVRVAASRSFPPDFARAADDDVAAVARAARDAVARLDRVVPHAPYNLVVQTAPRWHVEIVPRLGVLAGFEQTTGVHVTTLSPARSAAMLREAAP